MSDADREMWGWQRYAGCTGQDTTLFFAPNYFEKKWEKDAREAKAKQFCIRCPVRQECLEYALRIREDHGVWGGLNEMERRNALRKQEVGERHAV